MACRRVRSHQCKHRRGDDRDDVPSLERHREHAAVALAKPLLGLVMLLRGFADAIMMRTRQAIAVGDAQGYCRQL